VPQLDLSSPLWKRLTNHTFPSYEVTLIGEIFVNEKEVRALNDLRGDEAQAFIDVIHDVRLHTSSSKEPDLILLLDGVSSLAPSLALTRLWISPIFYHGSGENV